MGGGFEWCDRNIVHIVGSEGDFGIKEEVANVNFNGKALLLAVDGFLDGVFKVLGGAEASGFFVIDDTAKSKGFDDLFKVVQVFSLVGISFKMVL